MERIYTFGRFLFLVVVLGAALLYTEVGKKLLSKGVSELLSQRFERDIIIKNIDFTFPDNLTAYSLTLDIGLDEVLKIERLDLKTPLVKLINGDIINMGVEASSISIGGIVLEQANAQVHLDTLGQCWNYSIVASQNGLVEASIVGSVILEGESLGFIAETCLIEASGLRASLIEPFYAKIENKTVTLQPVQFILADSIIDLKGRCTPTALEANFFCRMSSLESLSWLLPDVFLTGSGTVQLNISGTWDEPEVNGSLAVADASVESLTSGAFFHQINAHAVINKTHFELVGLNARDLHGGSISMNGLIHLDPARGFPFGINMQLEKAALLDLEEIRSDFSGKLLLSGNWREAVLSGDLNIDELNLSLEKDSAPSIKHIDVVYVNTGTDDEHAPSKIGKENSWPFALDIQLHSRSTIAISDDQLTSKWKGDVKIAGSTNAPKLLGDWRLEHGEYLFNGKKFKLTEGTISFLGDWRKKTQLFVVGGQQVAGIYAEVVLKGPLNDLSLAFRSTPPLSEREILSRLLFGRSSGDITPFQGSELTESINKLKSSGKAGGVDLLSNFKRRLGIDRIDISRGSSSFEDENYSLQVGKYLSPGIFIGVTKGLTSETNRIGIEADLHRNMKLQAEIGDDSNGQLHLMWKHDY